MLGNRFSFTASAFVFASACSAILSGPTASAQQYQQTNYPQYSATSLPKLSTQATQAPVFSDTQNDATAMSPDGWGESAIRSPFAGYQPQPTTVQQTVVQQNATPAQANRASGSIGTYAPGTINSNAFAKVASNVKSAAADSDNLKSIMEPLTNTQYSRPNQTTATASGTAKAAYPENRYAQLPNAPGLPNLKPAANVQFKPSNDAGSFDQLLTGGAVEKSVEFNNNTGSLLDTNTSVPQQITNNFPNTMPTQKVTPSFVQQMASPVPTNQATQVAPTTVRTSQF